MGVVPLVWGVLGAWVGLVGLVGGSVWEGSPEPFDSSLAEISPSTGSSPNLWASDGALRSQDFVPTTKVKPTHSGWVGFQFGTWGWHGINFYCRYYPGARGSHRLNLKI